MAKIGNGETNVSCHATVAHVWDTPHRLRPAMQSRLVVQSRTSLPGPVLSGNVVRPGRGWVKRALLSCSLPWSCR
jgi:hypothetical protein